MGVKSYVRFLGFLCCFLGFCLHLSAQSFDLIPLGVYGGGDESNLSAYLIGEKDKNEFLSLDAGTVRAGLEKAVENKVFDKDAEYVLRNYIKGYFISHGHLDHLSGLIINAPDDKEKNIYGIPYTINILKNHYFTDGPWENFTDEGEKPRIGTYSYKRLEDAEQFSIEGTELKGQLFELSHVNPNKSSAVLVRNPQGAGVLYLGDTGADRIEKTDKLEKLWTAIAPLVNTQKLKAILIETSFPNEQPDDKLFGHLTPDLLNEELCVLAEKAGQENLNKLKIIITHLKPGGEQIKNIKNQLEENNPLNVQFIFPSQGEKLTL